MATQALQTNKSNSDTEAAILAGTVIADPKNFNAAQAIVLVPPGYEAKVVSREFKPSHIARNIELHDAESFVSYLTTFNDGLARVFADTKAVSFTAILDYHAADERGPNWAQHVAVFAPRKTTEWETWVKKNEVPMCQADFAQFIEDNIPDIIEPAGNVLFEVARTLEAKKNVKFSSGVRLDNGETQFLYEEEIKGTAQKGKLEIPQKFTLGLRPYEGGPIYKVEAFLRYRIGDGGDLKFWYRLNRPHKILEDSFEDMLADIAKKAGDITILRGKT